MSRMPFTKKPTAQSAQSAIPIINTAIAAAVVLTGSAREITELVTMGITTAAIISREAIIIAIEGRTTGVFLMLSHLIAPTVRV